MTVKIGQVWRDLDKRMRGRTLLVVSINETHAICSTAGGGTRRTKIRLDRFKKGSTGFELVHDTP